MVDQRQGIALTKKRVVSPIDIIPPVRVYLKHLLFSEFGAHAYGGIDSVGAGGRA
jgi:hypothetical protein